MQHGGDLISFSHYFDGKLIDFSSNINPVGIPLRVQIEIIKKISQVQAYPDLQYRSLKKSVAGYLGCEINQTLLGNGAVELIDLFTSIAERVVICTPCFSEYEIRARVHGKKCVSVSLNTDFSLNVSRIKKVLQKNDLLVLANPNNPTGLCIPEKTLFEIYKIVREKESFLLLDEAFFELSSCKYNSIVLFKKHSFKNIAIIRAATKFFALPGIRLGYACTNYSVVQKISPLQLPWHINIFADIAGNYIFNNTQSAFFEKSQQYLISQRNYLFSNLSKIKSIQVFKSECNFILIQLLDTTEDFAFDFFARRGIIIRKAGSFFKSANKLAGMVGEFIRIAVRTKKENKKILKVFKEFENIPKAQ
ncbi:MAG: aspartate aminotransferase [Treponema sp.]|nr:MAG: aspartate aminotransferase [Treponema sp.]